MFPISHQELIRLVSLSMRRFATSSGRGAHCDHAELTTATLFVLPSRFRARRLLGDFFRAVQALCRTAHDDLHTMASRRGRVPRRRARGSDATAPHRTHTATSPARSISAGPRRHKEESTVNPTSHGLADRRIVPSGSASASAGHGCLRRNPERRRDFVRTQGLADRAIGIYAWSSP